ncbi:MAG: hypothetical protein OXB95_11330, partial [Rhodobacteraceae bacterium]|nr:hypothetical protein [Paracoccaceae bacterium]
VNSSVVPLPSAMLRFRTCSPKFIAVRAERFDRSCWNVLASQFEIAREMGAECAVSHGPTT